jgi:tol-pal system protein YbgF
MARAGLPALVCASTLALASTWAAAQQPLPPPGGAPAAQRVQPKAATPKAPTAGAPATESQLRQRVEQLEEQLVDMQVLVGTLESLARGGGAAPARAGAPGGGASEAARIDALETQVRAMTMQIEELTRALRQRQGRGEDSSPPIREGALTPFGSQSQAAAQPPPAAPGGFGSMTVTPQPGDRIGQMISATPAPAEGGRLPPAIGDAGSAKELYETAYGYLLQQDYAAAEAAFDEFLNRYPNDNLTADAQYWLGETLFVQRRYKPAGQAFLRVVQNHRQSTKAPNSLLMLAMTLEQLGQKDCALFGELESKHPNASQEIKSRARVVKQRVGC